MATTKKDLSELEKIILQIGKVIVNADPTILDIDFDDPKGLGRKRASRLLGNLAASVTNDEDEFNFSSVNWATLLKEYKRINELPE